MKIGFFIGGLSGGGAERVCCNLTNFLSNHGNDVDIITMSDDVPTYDLSENISRIILIKDYERKNFLYNSILRFLRLLKAINNGKYNCIIVFLPITTILLLSIRMFVKCKIIAAERADPSIYTANKQSKLKNLAHRADAWVFQTKEQCQWYGKSVGNAIVKIIPNAINPDFIKKKRYSGDKEFVIVNSGRLTEQKNQSLLIRSFARISYKFPQYKLKIYGEGPLLKELKELAKQLDVSEKVIFSGYIKNISDELEKASLFVLSSDYEGMPNALMEAMALGLPCISTDCKGGGARFLIEDNINGLLLPRNNVDAMSYAIERLLSNDEFSRQLGREASKICEKLAPQIVYDEWAKFIKSII